MFMFEFFNRRHSISPPPPEAIEDQRTREVSAHLDAICDFIRIFPEQQICHVLASCEDGKMNFHNYCNCLLGVFSSSVIHQCCGQDPRRNDHHYHVLTSQYGRLALEAEYAYEGLGKQVPGSPGDPGVREEQQRLRDVYLRDLLRGELKRRERARATQQAQEQIASDAPFAPLLS